MLTNVCWYFPDENYTIVSEFGHANIGCTYLHLSMCGWQDLAEAMTGISQHAKQAQLDDFCDDVKKFANAVCVLTENSAQVGPENHCIVYGWCPVPYIT